MSHSRTPSCHGSGRMPCAPAVPLRLLLLLAVSLPWATFADDDPVIVSHLAGLCRFDEALNFASTLSPQVHSQRAIDLLKARLLVQLDRPKEALQLLRPWVADGERPAQAEVQFMMGLALGGLGQQKEAHRTLQRALALGTDPLLILGAEGLAEASAGASERAESRFLEALARDPTLTGALYNLSCVRARQGRVAEAAGLLRQAWHLGWRNVAKLKRDPWLERLRAAPGLIDDLLATPEADSRCATW